MSLKRWCYNVSLEYQLSTDARVQHRVMPDSLPELGAEATRARMREVRQADDLALVVVSVCMVEMHALLN